MAKKGFYVNLEERTHKRLKIFALANDMTMTETLEHLINHYCRPNETNEDTGEIGYDEQGLLGHED